MNSDSGANLTTAVHELEERERRSRAIFESTLDGMLILDGDGRVVEANFAAAALFGISPETFPGHSLEDHAASLRDVQRVWSEFRAAGRTRGEFEILRADGERRLVELTLAANFVPGQHLGVVRDLTDSRRNASARFRLAERFERLFRTELVGMALINRRTGCVDDCNGKMAEFFGRSPADFIGRHVAQFETFFPDRERYERMLVSWASGAPVRAVPMNSALPDGTQRQGLLTVESLPNTDDDESVDVALVVDVTAQHQLEAELRNAQRLEAIGRLAGGIAHDFNNLLAVITGYAELLEGAVADSADHRQSLEEIRRAAARAVKLIQGLLAFSRQAALDVRTVDLNEIIRTTASALQDVVGPQVNVELRLNAEHAHVRTDSLQLEHALLQLATNAREALSDGGQLTIETSNAGSDVHLKVTDNGIGMEPATLERVFEPFFTTKDFGGGNGLGLATVYGIVAQSEGRVTASSEPGLGTSIQIVLPFVANVEAASSSASRPEATSMTGTETIVLVEEDAAVAMLIETFLTRLGYRLVRAASDAEAVRVLEAYGPRIDLVIGGPGPSGKSRSDLLARLRESRPGLPAVLVTAYSPDAGSAPVTDAQTAMLMKPFSMSDLAGHARVLLDRQVLV